MRVCAMRDVLSLYPRFLVFSGIIAAFLIVLALIPASTDATTVDNPIQTSAADTTRKLNTGDCRLDKYAYTPTCQTQGRTIRVINF
jgi:hypothetical protein